jgi:hypothetical protein
VSPQASTVDLAAVDLPAATITTMLSGLHAAYAAARTAATTTDLYWADRQAALVTAVATTFTIDEDLAAVLLATARLKEPSAAGQPLLLDVLLDDSVSAATEDLQQRAIRLLQ